MTIIRWHGRGGQGAFTAARLLGAAYSLQSNRYALAFPSFGPERRGAPVQAFTKLSKAPIANRSEKDAADFAVFLDDTLFSEAAFSELKPEGVVLLNTKEKINSPRVVAINGSALALSVLGLPIANTVMLGAFLAVYPALPLSDVEAAVRAYMPKKLQEKNIAAVKEAMQAASGGVAL